jgi:hypothetical protein
MATWASLTADQKTAVQSVANAVRSLQITWQKLSEGGLIISAAWNGGVSDLVGSLADDATGAIPNDTGLAGAQSLSKADLTNMVGYLIDASNPANSQGGGGYNSAFHQALRIKACGVNAAIGS